MPPKATHPGEIHNIGRRTRESILDADACPLLDMYGISTIGISDAARGFRFARPSPPMSVLMACTSGRGRAWINNRYEAFSAGMAYLMPPHAPHAYKTIGNATWRVCWVCYLQSPNQTPFIPAPKPQLVRTTSEPLEESIRGLLRESARHADPALQRLYIDLIHQHALRLVHDLHTDDRLWQLWALVESDLAHPWTLRSLAHRGNLSIEILRQLSLRTTGRSPMKQVTFLRMRRAAALLASTDAKIHAIAAQVGYSDPFAFSVAFKRHLRLPPSTFRSHRGSTSIHETRRSA